MLFLFSKTSFIKDTPITKISLFEAMHTMDRWMKGKEGYMALKLDMSKAFDRVECGFWK
jgi:hypothetical protein